MAGQSRSALHRQIGYRLLCGLVLLAGLVLIRFGLPMDVDEGLTLAGGWYVSQGLTPYRDFFDFLAPGSLYLVGSLLWLLGANELVLRLAVVLFTLATMWALDRLVVRLGVAGWLRWVVLVLWLVLQANFGMINHNNFAQLASIWAMYLFIVAWQEGGMVWWISAGAFSALTIWMHQIRGVTVLAAGIGVLLLSRRRRAVAAYGGAALVTLLPLLAWPPGLLWRDLVAFPLTYYLGPNFVAVNLLLAAGTVLVAFAVAARWWVLPAAGFWPLVAFAGAGLASIWSRADVQYVMLVSWPLVVLAAAVAAAPWRQPTRPSAWILRRLAYWSSYVVVIQLVGWTAVSAATALALAQEHRRLGRETLWRAIAREVQQRTAPGEPIFATPYLPAVYFFAQRPNATRYSVLLSRHHPPEFFADAVASLERVKPMIVVRALGSFAVSRGFHRDGTILDAYLDAHYRVVQPQIGGYAVQLLERVASNQ